MSEQPTVYQEVPGSRTTQDAVVQPHRERIAYEELQPGDIIQEGDEWQNDFGRWQKIWFTPESSMEVDEGLRVRRPYKVIAILEIGDALANAQKAATQLQDERDNALAGLKSAQRARDELQLQVDELRTDRDRLQRLIDNLLDEPTARQVRDMLQTWATELDWSSGCFGSFGRSQIDIIQQTMIAVIQRIGSMIDPEATSADA